MTTGTEALGAGRHAGLDALAGEIEWAEVGGVPALYAPQAGPVTAGLVFRVGTADETLATAGITHLVEHLALFDQNLTQVHHNGVTAETYTLFHVTGGRDEVVRFMAGVCAALRDLPVHRLETEKTILRTEAATRSSAPGQLRLWRYGARGLGLSGYDQLGLPRLGADEVREWARTFFTRDNAAFFVTDDALPSGLELDLPPGARMAVPSTPSALAGTPAYFRGRDGSILLDAEVPRSTAAFMFSKIAGRALFRDLRQEGGYSYTAGADYTPWQADRATLRLYADSLPDHQDAALGAFVDSLATLRLGDLDEAELDVVRRGLCTELEQPDQGARNLPAYAIDLLWGGELIPPHTRAARYESVTPDDVRAVAHEVWSDALVQVPTNSFEWAGAVAAPRWSSTTVTGTRFPRGDDSGITLVLGDDGVSLTSADGSVTVRFDECEAMTTRPDGARYLVGADGFYVTVEPTLHPGLTAEHVSRLVDARVHPGRVVALPARDPDDIPRPAPRAPLIRRWARTALAPLDRAVQRRPGIVGQLRIAAWVCAGVLALGTPALADVVQVDGRFGVGDGLLVAALVGVVVALFAGVRRWGRTG